MSGTNGPMLGGLPGLNDPEAATYGFGGGPQDPYLQMLLRRRMMAQALEQREPQQPMTHWTQVLGHIANKGVNAWKEDKAERDMLDYTKNQRAQSVAAFLKMLPNAWGGQGDGAPAPISPSTQPPTSVAEEGTVNYGGINVPAAFAPHIEAASKAHNVPAPLLAWVGNQESGFRGRPGMTDPRDNQTPQGPWQFKPSTGARYGLGLEDLNDPAKSTMGAGAYLADLYKQHGNWADAIGKGYGTFSPRPGETSDVLRQKFTDFATQFADPQTGVGTPVEAAYAAAPVGGTQTSPQQNVVLPGPPVAGGPQPATQPNVAPQGMQITPRQRLQMTAAFLKAQAGDTAGAAAALAAAFPEPKLQGYAPGSEIRDQTGRVVGRVPERPMSVAPGAAMVDPATGRPIYTNPGDAATTRIQMTNDLRGEGSFSQERGKAIAARLGEWEAAWDKGHQEKTRIANFAKMQDQFDTGAFSTTKITLGQVAQRFGIPDSALSSLGMDRNQIASGEVIRSISNKMMMENLGPGGFPSQNFSNADAERLAQSLPGLANSPQGNKIMLQIAGAVADRKIEIGKAWRQWARTNGENLDSVTRFQQEKLPSIVERDVIAPLLQDERGMSGASGPPSAALDFLRANPGAAIEFDQKYGPGAAARVLSRQ